MSRSVGSLVAPFPTGERLDTPSPMDAVRRGYLDQAVISYLVYGVGAVTSFIAVALSLTDSEAGLHSTAVAGGMVAEGLSSPRLDGWLGMRAVHFLGLAALLVSVLLIASAPHLGLTLVGAAMVGLGAGLLLGHVNLVMSAGGGPLARVRIARSTLVAMCSSVTVPLFIGVVLRRVSAGSWQQFRRWSWSAWHWSRREVSRSELDSPRLVKRDYRTSSGWPGRSSSW